MISNNTNESGSAEYGVTNESDIVFMTTYIIEASAITLINLLTIITFTINRHLRKRSMYCVINLAVADMVLGIGILVIIISWKIYGTGMFFYLNYSDQSSIWRYVLILVTGTGTMLSLALVALERMYATVWPVRHRNARHWAYTLAFSMTWSAAAMSGLLTAVIITAIPDRTMTLHTILNLIGGLGICVVVAVICVSYIVIFIKVKKQQKQMPGQRVSIQDQKLAMTLFIVTMASFATMIPGALVLIAARVVIVPYYLHGAVNCLALSNSLINPTIYVLRMKDFRKALLHLILKCSRHRPTLVVPQPN